MATPRNGQHPESPGRVYGRGRAAVPGQSGTTGGAGTATDPVRSTGRARVGGGTGWGSADGAAVARSSAGRGAPAGPPPQGPTRRGATPRWGRIALVVAVLLVASALLVTGGLALYAKSLNDDLARTDPFSEITGGRPVKTVDGSLNLLLLGSDSRDPDKSVGDSGAARTDTIIIMHIPASHDQAYLVSLPRDLYVNVPKTPDGQFGGRRAKINAAFAWGGLPLMVQTVEGFSGVRMDHVVVIDFFGFKDVTDALGGVDLYIEQDIKSIHPPHYRQFTKGTMHLNGEEALDYVRQRYQFKDGDFARVRHQQEFLKALMDKAISTGTVTNPAKLNAFLKAATKAITVDQGFSLVDMAVQFRNLRSDQLTFMTSPYSGTDTINGESVVLSDRAKAVELYEAMAADKMADWVAANPKPGG
jgi:LCP family protein required for cell wall assembly